jgi:hypothetical protein
VPAARDNPVILAEILAVGKQEIGSVVMPPTAPGNHENRLGACKLTADSPPDKAGEFLGA